MLATPQSGPRATVDMILLIVNGFHFILIQRILNVRDGGRINILYPSAVSKLSNSTLHK